MNIGKFFKNFFYKIRQEKILVIIFIFVISFYLINVFAPSPEKNKQKEILKSLQTEVQILLSSPRIIKKIKNNFTLKLIIYSFTSIFFLFLIGGVFLNVSHFIFKKKLFLKTVPQKFETKWSIFEVFKISIITFFIWQFLYLFKGAIFNMLQISRAPNILKAIVFSTFLQLIAVVCIFYYIKNKYRKNLTSLGLTSRKILTSIGRGIIGYVFIIPSVILAIIIGGLISNYIGYKPESNPLFLIFFLPIKNSIIIYIFLFIVLIGPFCEEVFFRGFLYNSFKNKFGVKVGIIGSSIVFSFLHVDPIGFLPIFLLAIMLAYIYEKTGSLIAPITAHVLHNTVVIVFMLILRTLAIG